MLASFFIGSSVIFQNSKLLERNNHALQSTTHVGVAHQTNIATGSIHGNLKFHTRKRITK